MERQFTATFIGHDDCTDLDEQALRAEIERLISCGVKEFLDGGMGRFDMKCARLVSELKVGCPWVKCCLVIPYLSFKPTNPQYFDEVVYPDDFERYRCKAAIPKRNEYLLNKSAFAICYVNHSFGGAYKTYELAKKKGLNLVNLGSIETQSCVFSLKNSPFGIDIWT